MKKAIFTLALMLSAFAGNAQTSLRGDVNNDGTVSLSDIMLLVDIILYEDATQAYTACPDNNHPHLIDLGLPSSTKWSCCNVGASKPEAYGGYYAWGETQEKSLYDYTTYKNTIDKNGDNITDNDEITVPYEDIAGTKFDVASVKFGGSWVMPSEEQFKELAENCTSKWTKKGGVNGRLFTSKKNKGSIFLPAAGCFYGDEPEDVGSEGFYWSSILVLSYAPGASCLTFNSDELDPSSFFFLFPGYSIRPVTDNVHTVNLAADLDDDGKVSLSDILILVDIILHQGDTPSNLICPDNNHPHLIDLGLPSGTKWACCNVDANKPEAFGGYYAWGETKEKSIYNHLTYQYVTGVDEDGDGYYDDYHEDTEVLGIWQNIGSNIAGTKYDVAHAKWGGSWVMPTLKQQDELRNNCDCEITTINGVKGAKFTSKKNGRSIFLPEAGHRVNSFLYSEDGHLYWSSTPDTFFPDYANALFFEPNFVNNMMEKRYFGHTVRPVSK